MTLRARARALIVVGIATAVVAAPMATTTASAKPRDTRAPVGSFVVISATGSDDPGPMVVEVVQNSLRDNRTPVDDIVREVNWGTGVGYEPWRSGTSIDFTYTTVGRYDLAVRVTDAAGNHRVKRLGTVVVEDTFAPRLQVNRPASDERRAWRSVSGYARDVGLSGIDFVRVKAVQQRVRGWFAYRGAERGWKRAGKGYDAARRAAAPVRVGTTGNGTWTVSLDGIGAGRLMLRSFARDHEGNRSKVRVVRRTLTR